ncbi:MAG: amidohydrolase family protein [Armatimonadetes bacterium]|nr:amidohydrolase family protein [Armatimonadota bacterium]
MLTAAWVLPVEGPPIREGAVVIEDGRLAWVGARSDVPSAFRRVPRRDFPRGLLLPGLVNAHCHVQLIPISSGLCPGSEFVPWVRGLIAAVAEWSSEEIDRTTRAGLQEVAAAGITTVAHVSAAPRLAPFLESPLRAVVFHEVLGFPEARAEGQLAVARAWLDGAGRGLVGQSGRVGIGIAAHAPYSVSASLLRGLVALARERDLPFSIHLAETREEATFLATGGGPFRDLLRERGGWDDAWSPPGMGPVAYAERLGLLDAHGLAVHLNYLEPGDLDRLRRGRLTACWCPGAHRWFGHPAHPAAAMLAAGIPLALGTDSLASNDALDLLREMRLAAATQPEVPPAAWLRAATLGGAEALGLAHEIGSLRPSKAADLTVVEPFPEMEADPHRALLSEAARVRFACVNGRPVRTWD